VVDLATPAAAAAPLDPVADEWARRTRQALDLVDRGIDASQPLGMAPDEYRARLVAVKLVLGAQKSGLPLPTRQALGALEVEAKDGDRTIRLRFADGMPVNLPLNSHGRREARRDDEEEG
jgi:hypothetical protein